MTLQLRITQKLTLVFVLFILIFFGTILVLFTNMRQMMAASEQIVSKNNRISALSKIMYESLLSMDVNDKKYRLLSKEPYLEYFEEAKGGFEDSIEQILLLESSTYEVAQAWKALAQDYALFMGNKRKQIFLEQEDRAWAPEKLTNKWLEDISAARLENENEIELSLVNINNRSRQSVNNGLIGMGVTVCAGILATWILSKSILIPLRELQYALKTLPADKSSSAIDIQSQDEFGELATAFNVMSKQLKEEEELRSEFIATLSHEIRTPLSTIRESVNMILEEVLGSTTDKQKKFLAIARSEIARMHDLLNHLLQVSQLDSKIPEAEFEWIEPNKLVDDVSRGLQSAAKIKDVSISINHLPNPPQIRGARKELQQLLFNLVENAVKFSPRGSDVTISISRRKSEGKLVFQIADEGPGIPEPELSLVFSKYYRAKNVRDHMDGVGLGLHISQKIARFHDGEIYVKNNAGDGCSFYCLLPCGTVPAAGSRGMGGHEDTAADVAVDTKTLKISRDG